MGDGSGNRLSRAYADPKPVGTIATSSVRGRYTIVPCACPAWVWGVAEKEVAAFR